MFDIFGFIKTAPENLSIPKGFMEWYLNKDSCDGCGTKWYTGTVPDSIFFLDIKLCCCIHDYRYSMGGSYDDFVLANDEFLHNLLMTINSIKSIFYPTRLARHRARIYYKAVSTDYAFSIFSENNKEIK